MCDDEKIIEKAFNVTKSCLLPKLINSLDAKPMQYEDFDTFRLVLNDNLHLLLDLLHQHEDVLLKEQAFDSRLTNFRVNLVLLICEQTSTNPFFQTDQEIVLKPLENVLEKYFTIIEDQILEKVLSIYKEQLIKSTWKRHLGSVYGFLIFCKNVLTKKSKIVDSDKVMFILSVGSILLSHYEPCYKTIGLKLFHLLLENCNKVLLVELNIHSVIYSECFAITMKVKDLEHKECLWDCLYSILSIDSSEIRDSNWSKFDDVMQALLHEFGFESDPKSSIHLFYQVLKFSAIGTGIEIESYVKIEDHFPNFQELKDISVEKENVRTMRWVKELMATFIRESTKMLMDPKDSLIIINAFHISYILSIYCIDSSVLDKQLTNFMKKFTILLMQTARTFSTNPKILHSIAEFLKTLSDHLKRSDNSKELQSCFTKILQEDMFKSLSLES
ncbi:unnamed protein product [Diamesa serratosioi]